MKKLMFVVLAALVSSATVAGAAGAFEAGAEKGLRRAPREERGWSTRASTRGRRPSGIEKAAAASAASRRRGGASAPRSRRRLGEHPSLTEENVWVARTEAVRGNAEMNVTAYAMCA